MSVYVCAQKCISMITSSERPKHSTQQAQQQITHFLHVVFVSPQCLCRSIVLLATCCLHLQSISMRQSAKIDFSFYFVIVGAVAPADHQNEDKQ